MFVKPAEGRRVLRPNTKRVLPAEGAEVTGDAFFWQRRIEQGDVEVVEPPAEPETTDEPAPNSPS